MTLLLDALAKSLLIAIGGQGYEEWMTIFLGKMYILTIMKGIAFKIILSFSSVYLD